MKKTAENGLEIAVIGMAGCFPGAKDIDQYWENLKNGVESISFFSHEELIDQGISADLLKNPNYIKAKSYLPEVQYFDADFFGYSPRETQILDIQMRLFHQVVYHGLENAGYNPENYQGQIGIYAGASTDINWYSYLLSLGNRGSTEMFESSTLANKDMLSQLISYKLNLKGPAQTLYTTCSTSLTAIHNACRALLLGECSIALAGGVTINLPLKSGYLYADGMILSKDGHCRAFDEKASGTIFGDGAGVVVLKRLTDAIEDHDTIYAVVKASACNNDGRRKVGLSAPSVEGQADVIRAAIELSGIDQEQITYIEAHATGTNIGDPIEIAALRKAFTTPKKNYCALGSVKANIGHLHAAAGVASFIKTVFQLYHKTLVPQINCDEINVKMELHTSPFFINTQLKNWVNADHPLCAGVSSFGIGGTNTHIVLEECPAKDTQNSSIKPGHEYLLLLSAKSKTSLETLVSKYSSFFDLHHTIDVNNVCYTLQQGRRSMGYRTAFVLTSPSDYKAILDGQIKNRHFSSPEEVHKKTVILLLNLPAQPDVAHIYDSYKGFPVFTKSIEACTTILKSFAHITTLSDVWLNTGHKSEYTDVATFMIEYALAKMWMELGIHPDYLIGTGKSEWVAGVLSGALSLDFALPLVYWQAVESGKTEKGIPSRLLPNEPPLFSKSMEPVVEKLVQRFSDVKINKNTIPFYSSCTGKLYDHSQDNPVNYWLSVISRPVNENRIFQDILNKKNLLFIHPGNNPLAREWLGQKNDHHSALYTIGGPDKNEHTGFFLLKTLGQLWALGADIEWNLIHAKKAQRIALPSYPFENKKIWHFTHITQKDPSTVPNQVTNHTKEYNPRPELSNDYKKPELETEIILVEILEELFGIKPIGVTDDFFELGGHSLLITQVVARVKEIFQYDLDLNEVFDEPTVKTMLNHLTEKWGSIAQVEEIAQAYREYQITQ